LHHFDLTLAAANACPEDERMILVNATYEQWKLNHQENHPAKWYRKFYPFKLFGRLDFAPGKVGVRQQQRFGRCQYIAEVESIELQPNGRYKAVVRVLTEPAVQAGKWDFRSWDCRFEVIYSSEGRFITVFASKLDPTKDLVTRFMKGTFDRIEVQRSAPLSEALAEALVVNIAEQLFPGGAGDMDFEQHPKGVRDLVEHPNLPRKPSSWRPPVYSVNRSLWICCAHSEERAHRVAYCVANQCERLIVVYVNPTFTRHHRCKYPETEVISLFELSRRLPEHLRRDYARQILFLQNYLVTQQQSDSRRLLAEIKAPLQQEYPIRKPDLVESLSVMRTSPRNAAEFFHFIAGMNLINAWLARSQSAAAAEARLFRDMYYFKAYLAEILTVVVTCRHDWGRVYVDKQVVIVELEGLQFSFHHVPLSDGLLRYAASSENSPIVWSGKRLQPVAPLVLAYARARLLGLR
jgi:hypothetical protein